MKGNMLKTFFPKVVRRHNWEDIEVDGRIIFNSILRELGMRMRAEFT
jgi:hypothetical protein